MPPTEEIERVFCLATAGRPGEDFSGIVTVKNALGPREPGQLRWDYQFQSLSKDRYMARLQARLESKEEDLNGLWGRLVVGCAVVEAAKNVAEYSHNRGMPRGDDFSFGQRRVRVYGCHDETLVYRLAAAEVPAPGFDPRKVMAHIEQKKARVDELARIVKETDDPEAQQRARVELANMICPDRPGGRKSGTGLTIMHAKADYLGFSTDSRYTIQIFRRPPG